MTLTASARFLSLCWPSLLGRGRERTSASRLLGYADPVGCILVWWQSVETAWRGCRGRLAFTSLGWHRHPWDLESRPLYSNPLRRGWAYRLVPLFREMQTRLKAFFEPPGVCGFRLCARTNLKKSLVPYSSGWWDVRQIPESGWVYTRRRGICSTYSSKLPNVGFASIPPKQPT